MATGGGDRKGNSKSSIIKFVVYKSIKKTNKIVSKCYSTLIDFLNWQITPSLLGNKPNTYLFVKSLVEQLLHEEGKHLPLAIVRPSIGKATHLSFLCAALNESESDQSIRNSRQNQRISGYSAQSLSSPDFSTVIQ